jgi:hypothetical protein
MCLHTVQESQKVLIKCPFKVKFSLIGYVAARKVPDVFHKVKITRTKNFDPSCQLSPVFLREAKRRGGHLKLDAASLKTVLDLLRQHPNTKARVLRPYLIKALPTWHLLDSHYYVSNFRRRAVKYWIIHGSFEDEDPDLTMTDTGSLLSPQKAVDNNRIDLDDESVWTNYEKLLRRVMQESSETWKVKKYLEDCKAKTPGFQYVIDCNDEGKHVCITWATPRMLRDLNCVFLT